MYTKPKPTINKVCVHYVRKIFQHLKKKLTLLIGLLKIFLSRFCQIQYCFHLNKLNNKGLKVTEVSGYDKLTYC